MTLNELYHHGILGMKWGVRRYQNTDGTLTAKGKQRYAKVEGSSLLSKRDTRTAKKILNKEYKSNVKYKSVADQETAKYRSKANTLREYGTGQRDDAKALKYDAKADKWAKKGSYFSEAASVAKTKYDAIDSGKWKAGRDFIVQTDVNLWPIIGVGMVATTEKRVISKNN
jgi:hypothetical protein